MSEEEEGEYLTVAEAAAHLEVSVPRLRRLLSRPPFDSETRTRTRTGRTGTRPALCVPVPVLVSLQSALERQEAGEAAKEAAPNENGNRNENGNEHAEKEPNRSRSHSPAEVETLREQLAQARMEAAASAAHAKSAQEQADRLNAALVREQETSRAALTELAEARRRSDVLIAAAAQGRLSAPGMERGASVPMPDIVTDAGQNRPPESAGSPYNGPTTSPRQEGRAEESQAQDIQERPRRAWWQWWKQ